MRALVTGSAGFVGRHFLRRLHDDGWAVDHCDTTMGADAIDAFRYSTTTYDLVVHAAANVGGRARIDGDPLWIAHNLAIDEACFRFATRTRSRVLYFSSSASYPVALQERGTELRQVETTANDVWSADSSYGAVKVMGEFLARQAQALGVPVHIVRPFSGYGTDQSLDYPFPSFIDRARRRADPFDVWGDGTQVRDWVHIDDIVEACLRIIDAECFEPVNLCTGIGTSFLELADKVCAAVGYEPTVVPHPDKPTGVHHRVGDPTLMREFWEPRVTLDEGIARAVAA